MSTSELAARVVLKEVVRVQVVSPCAQISMHAELPALSPLWSREMLEHALRAIFKNVNKILRLVRSSLVCWKVLEVEE